jgi:hypothetical protein
MGVMWAWCPGGVPQDGADPATRRADRRDMARAACGSYRQFPGGTCQAARPMSWATVLRLRVSARSVRSCPSACRNGRPTPRSMPAASRFSTGWGRSVGRCLSGLGTGAVDRDGVRPVAWRTCAVTGSTEDLIYVSPARARGVACKAPGTGPTACCPCRPVSRGRRPRRPKTFCQVCARRGISCREHLAPRRSGTGPALGAATARRPDRAAGSGGNGDRG